MRLKVIEEYPDYLISDTGKVFSLFSSKFRINQRDTDGYLHLNLCKKGYKPKTMKIHRLVCFAFVSGYSEDRNQVNHIDGDKTNNNAINLEWVNPSENLKHAYRNKLKTTTKVFGEESGMSKLTESQVSEIRYMINFLKVKELAKMYSLSISHVYRIINRKSWNHI